MVFSLEGRVAIVTGASRGLGRAIALKLARQGASVVVNYKRKVEMAEEVCAEIVAMGGVAVPMQADIADASQAQNLINQTFRQFKRLDI
jgi:3-oxoacyl-[acyl-carrier protein] reductase